MNKKVPLWIVLLTIWFSLIVTITFGWAVWHIKSNGPLFKGKTSRIIISIASIPAIAKEGIAQIFKNPLVQDVYPEVNGLKTDRNFIDSNYVLLPTYDEKVDRFIVKLIRLSDQKKLHQWTPDFDKFKEIMGDTDNGFDLYDADKKILMHPLLSLDGSIVFNNCQSLLIKLDKNSKILWTINGLFNHSLEFDVDGNIWVPSEINHSKFLPEILDDFKDDAITKVTPDGKLVFEKSIAQLLLENGYRGLLLGVGPYDRDFIHINDIQPALTSGKYWEKGDLLISLKNRSTVFLYRPSTNKVLWLKTGPWLNQHDVDFIDSVSIGIFGNNIVRMEGNPLIDGHNEEYIYNFETGSITTPYTAFLKNASVSTKFEGRSDILSNGDLFVEETNKSRLLRGNAKNTIWQFVNRVSPHSVAAISWSRFITKEEFEKLNFLKSK